MATAIMPIPFAAPRSLRVSLRAAFVFAAFVGSVIDSGSRSASAHDAIVAPLVMKPQIAGNDIAALALANVGKGACSTNTLGGTHFESSCTGNGGQPEYWCADFALWVWASAGVTDVAGLDAAAGSFYVYGQNHGTLSNTPAVGDAVVFDYAGGGVADHVAIVTLVNADGTIESVSGDWNGTGSTEAGFSSTSSVVRNAPAYASTVGGAPSVVGMTISGYIAPVGLGADYAAQFVSQSFPLASSALSMTAGDTVHSFIELQNTGTKTWDSNTRLATTQPRDRASVFASSSWLAPNRLASVTGTVAPGATYKFEFDLHAPDAAGTYFEYFGVVEEGVAWFSDSGQGGPSDDDLEVQIVVAAPAVGAADAGSDASEDAGAGSGGSVQPEPIVVADGGSAPASDGANGSSANGSRANEPTNASSNGASSGGCAVAPASSESGAVSWMLAIAALAILVARRGSVRGSPRRGARLTGASLATITIVAAGCSSSSQGEATGETESAATTQKGVDYSFARPSPAGIRAAGYTFAARYLSDDSSKNLSASEVKALRAAGVDVVANWENAATDALDGYATGVSDAKAADSQAKADGIPAGRPIYFSVDFDATPAQQTAINSYFDGVVSVIGLARTGAYGGYYVIQRLFDANKIKWGWQTYAWSGGQWDSRAQLRQVDNGVTVAGGSCDVDDAVAADFGQWGYVVPGVRGYLDSAACTAVAGWAQDESAASTAIPADLYFDAPAGQTGSGAMRVQANISRPDLCTAIGSCAHGYSVAPPPALMDGKAHEVYVYGIAAGSGPNVLLTGSPKTFTCQTPVPPLSPTAGVKRHITSETSLAAWHFTSLDIAKETAAEVASYAFGEPLAAKPMVVIASGAPAVWVIDGTVRRHVVSPASLSAWDFTVVTWTAAQVDAYPQGADWPKTPFVLQAAGDPAVYVLDTAPAKVTTDGGAADEDGGVGDEDGGVEVGDDDGGFASVNPEAGMPIVGSGPLGANDDDAGETGGGTGGKGGCTVSPAQTGSGAVSWMLGVAAFGLLAARRFREGGSRLYAVGPSAQRRLSSPRCRSRRRTSPSAASPREPASPSIPHASRSRRSSG